MIFTTNDKLSFFVGSVLVMIGLLTACCVLEKRLEELDYYDEPPNIARMPFMANGNLYKVGDK
jgi:hypothetical protein